MNFAHFTPTQRRWIEEYCNETLSTEEFVLFEAELEKSALLRGALRQYLALDAHLRQGSESLAEIGQAWRPVAPAKVIRFRKWIPIAAAAAAAFLIGLFSDRILPAPKTPAESGEITDLDVEVKATGYAVLHGLVGADISARAGDILGAETFRLTRGNARIDFFSGAQIYLEGPATLEIRSAWEAVFHAGKMRAKVPPAARGFTIESQGRRIVDLGTEFGIDTSTAEVRVEVFTGKVELADRQLTSGQAVSLTPEGQTTTVDSGIESYSNLFAVSDGLNTSARRAFESWTTYSDTLSRDPRLIAYYPFLTRPAAANDVVPSGLHPRDTELDGAVILAEWVDGRWGDLKGAMEFRRPGSRVRVNLPGQFAAYTFSCWARIDSLDRRYNALFLADSYQTGEPHWQIRDDGVLMIGVMVDDTHARVVPTGPPILGQSRNYYSPPFWNLSMSGQWVHLASVYDPAQRRVAHFVNGQRVSEDTIAENYVVRDLKIGNAEIGNWAEPTRTDPEFAIRNLNGRIDELAIFQTALTDDEIGELFRRGQSQ